MQITLSDSSDPRGEHLVLVCSAKEAWFAHDVVANEILKGRARPVKERRGDNILFRFNLRFLDRVGLAFPMADLSDRVYSMLKKQEVKRLAEMPVPTCNWPGLKATLRDYQKIGAKKIVDQEIDILSDGMGLGKTIQVLAAMRKMKAFPALVVCPNSVKQDAWANDAAKFLPGVSVEVVDGDKHQRADSIRKRADITVINFEGIRAKAVHQGDNPYAPIIGYDYSNPDLFDFVYEFVAIDEFHRCFPAGTSIAAPSGDIAIESVSKGDVVYGYSHDNGELVETKVLGVQAHRVKASLHRIKNATMTPEHPVWTQERGYVAASTVLPDERVVEIDESRAGVRVVRAGAGPRQSGEGSEEEDYITVYNFETETGNYFAEDLLVHNCKTPGAQVTNGFFELIGEKWAFLSGTPILNRPEEIWTVLHKVYPEDYSFYEAFVNQIAIREGAKVVAYKPDAMADLKKFLGEISLRRRKEQVIDDLPEVVHVSKQVTLSGEERKLYNKLRDEFLLELEDGSVTNVFHVLPQIMRLKQAAFSPELYGGSKKSSKIEELKEIVAELVESGEKAIIFSQWSTATRIIQRELEDDYEMAYVTGEIKMADRQEQIDRFNNDPNCVLYVGTIGANKEGINLGAASYVIFTDFPWTPAEADQAIARSAAGGLRGAGRGISHVHVIELQAEDTIEERIQGMLARKRAIFDRMVERDAGKKVEKITVSDIRDLM